MGHTQPTTYRYANANVETARRAADALNELHAASLDPTSNQPAMINQRPRPLVEILYQNNIPVARAAGDSQPVALRV